MKRKNATRNALFTSIISLLLCVSMLVGTTFAWFTDEVVSGTNVIASGNLDVELVHTNGKVADDDVAGDTALFVDENGETIKWEPGVVTYETLTVKNVGTLALKYQLGINFTNANYVEYADGSRYTLADALKVGVINGALGGNTTRESLVAAVSSWQPLSSFVLSGTLEDGKNADPVTLVIYWEPSEDSHDNLFNINNTKTTSDGKDYLHIDLGINLFATQVEHEEDSFDNTYDKDLEMPEVVAEANTVNAFVEALEAGKVAKLTSDLTLSEDAEIPEGVTSAIDLNGHTLTLGNNGIVATGNLIVNNGTINMSDDDSDLAISLALDNGAAIEIGEDAVINVAPGATGMYLSGNNSVKVDGNIAVADSGYGVFTNYANNITIDMTDAVVTGEGYALYLNGGTANVIVGEGVTGPIMIGGAAEVTIYYTGSTAPAYKTDGTAVDVKLYKLTNYEGITQNPTNAKQYYIESKAGLMNLNALLSSVAPSESNIITVELETDVDLTGEQWEPIVSMWVIFNGNNHTISNLTAGMDASGRRSGFWSYAGAVTINDLTLENVNVSGSQAGTFAGSGEGLKINNCYLKGTNSVTFAAGVETWNGIGAITGVIQTSNVNVTIVENATVSLNPNGMTTDPGCIYVDDLTGYITANNGTVTNNGTIIKCISTADELAALGGTKINGHYALMNDINMAGKEMKSMIISGGANVTFNGNDYTISNLNLGAALNHGMTGEGNEVAGLFDMSAPATTLSLTVNDLTVANATVKCNGYAAAIVGYNSNASTTITLNNVDVSGATVEAESVAALVAYTTGPVNMTNCDVSALSLTGEEGRPEKVGAYIGTANTESCAVTATNCTNATTYNDYGRVIGNATWNGAVVTAAASQDELNSAVSSSNNVLVTLGEGEYTVPTNLSAGQEVTIVGNENTEINITNGIVYPSGNVVTMNFEGVTINGSGYSNGLANTTATFTNCTFNTADMYLYRSAKFINCTFNDTGTYSIWTWGAGTVEFDGCTFNTTGKALYVNANVLDNGTNHQTVYIKNCKFYDTGDNNTQKAAIETGDDYDCHSYDIYITNTTVEGFAVTEDKTSSFNYGGTNFGTNVWGNKYLMGTDKLNVVIDGVDVY